MEEAGELGKAILTKNDEEVIDAFANEWDLINANRKDKKGNVLPYVWKDNPWVFPIGYSLFFQGRGVYENNRRTAGNSK